MSTRKGISDTLSKNLSKFRTTGGVVPVADHTPIGTTFRESEDSSFDWFKSYNDIADIIRDTLLDPLPPPSRLDAHCPGPFFVRVLRHFPLPTPSDFPIEGQDVPG